MYFLRGIKCETSCSAPASGATWVAVLLLAASCLVFGCNKQADIQVPTPERALGSVIGGLGIRAFALHGDEALATVETVAVNDNRAFVSALRLTSRRQAGNPWDVQLAAHNRTRVLEGDILFASFYVRAHSSTDERVTAATEFVFELAREPWSKSITYPVRASRAWQHLQIPFRASRSFKPGEAQILFRLGYAPQTLELANVVVTNYGSSQTLSSLPHTRLSYEGRSADSTWRAEATRRIREHRMAEFEIRVQDRRGKPIANAQVDLELKQLDWLFGSAVAAAMLQPERQNQDAQRYRTELRTWFNAATIENALKWPAMAGDRGSDFGPDSAVPAIDWLRRAGLMVRGHALVWPSWRHLPHELKRLENDPALLRAAVNKRVSTTVTKHRGMLSHWDVLNEPFDNHDLMDVLGAGVMTEWFQGAKASDPQAKLYVNDAAILSGGGTKSGHRDYYEQTIEALIASGAPVDGIGFQGHFTSALTSPHDVYQLLNRFARFDRPLLVTEYDVVLEDERLAADYTRDFLITLFSHPLSEGVLLWGFWDGRHWKNNAPLFRGDWSEKPAAAEVRRLFSERWMTKKTGATGADGAFLGRGFRGQYEVRVRYKGQSKTQSFALTADPKPIFVQLD